MQMLLVVSIGSA